jgi:hypothetical protein
MNTTREIACGVPVNCRVQAPPPFAVLRIMPDEPATYPVSLLVK